MIEIMGNDKISIVQVAAPQNTSLGDYYYRVESPAKALSALERVQAVISITNIHRHKEKLMRECDILILCHVCDPDLLPIIAERKAKGRPTIFEIWDNIEDIQPWNLTCLFWKNEENRTLFYKLAASCDALQANNRELLNKFKFLNASAALFPNQIKAVHHKKKKAHRKHVIIGWAGSHGHLDDVKSIVPALISVVKNNDHIKLALMASAETYQLFDGIPREKIIYQQPGTIQDYYDFLKTIDIGLAPLKDTPYNRCRSDIKFLEYAAHGVLPVLQDLSPYRNADTPPGTRYLFKTPEELEYILGKLLSRTTLRKEIIKNAKTYVKTCRLEKQNAQTRLEFYAKLLDTRRVPEPGTKNGCIDSLRGYVPNQETDFEKNLYNGLVYLENRNQPERALEMFQRAESLVPDSYLPALFSSQCTENPVIELKKALHKNPLSLKAALLLGEYYAKTDNLQSALMTFKDLINTFPDYDLPYRRSAEILKHANMKEAAEKLWETANQVNPWMSATTPEKTPPNLSSQPNSLPEARLYLIMPRGTNHGWGICGKYLACEISKLDKLTYITEPFTAEDVGDELDQRNLRAIFCSLEEFNRSIAAGDKRPVNIPLIQAIQGNNMLPWGPVLPSSRRIGYTFFEDNILPAESIANARQYFDVVVAGSKWCQEVLRGHGLERTGTIIQGIDADIFNPYRNHKQSLKDRFVIFSGGKFEFRKGQDLVIRAFKHLRQKYDDVLLLTSWYNPWPTTLHSMSVSKYIQMEPYGGDYLAYINKLLHLNGIDPESVISLPPKPNMTMAKFYKNSDIGLFPNRCEGGTNLVLMEYMACGKPVVASFNSGHKDILTDFNSLPLRRMNKIDIRQNEHLKAVWDESDLDEIIAKLEWAYSHREALDEIGRTAGQDLSHLTWKKAAQEFYDLAFQH